MNHQPFENWLLSEEPLSQEQSRALREHLDGCEKCRQIEPAWNGVQALIHAVPEIAPAPGFTLRGQARLAEQRRTRQQKQTWAFLAGTSAIALGLLMVLGFSLLSLVEQPEQLMIYAVYRLATFMMDAMTAGEFLTATMRSLSGAIPFAVVVVVSGLASMLSVLWFVLVKQLIARRRVVQ